MVNDFNNHFEDDNSSNGDCPSLRIIIQPMKNFRFRYTSENQSVGSHGCLLGETCMGRNKTHPTVELLNYSGNALIKCELAQHDNSNEHPHRLFDDDNPRDFSCVVPENGSYAVGFAGIGIIHTAKKNVREWILTKLQKNNNNKKTSKELKSLCDKMVKDLNLNIVRLKFSAYYVDSDEEICAPIFSQPIYNLKSAATNDLKISRMSHSCGRACGGDDIIVLVEKVSKKDIQILFYEEAQNGERVWSAKARFVEADVHHQYAISFRTPAYDNPNITSDVTVRVQLHRVSDGRTSKHVTFTYKADPLSKMLKRRKIAEARPVEVPVVPVETSFDIVSFVNNNEPTQVSFVNNNEPTQQIVNTQQVNSPSALNYGSFNPLLSQTSPFDVEDSISTGSDLFDEEFINDYFSNYTEFLHKDSGRGDGYVHFRSASCSSYGESTVSDAVQVIKSSSSDYSACYTAEDGAVVKKLVGELCKIVKNKKGHNKQELRNILERLFEKRLSNGDTFLHMALVNNRISFEFMVKVIHNVKITFLLDLQNDNDQTILHLAVAYNSPEIVSLLISKGCSPMVKDHEGNNPIHYAVMYRSCLESLLDSIKKNDVVCDLNDSNNEKQSPLHLASVHDCASSTRALLAAGASLRVRDSHQRTPLHLAAYDDKLAAATELLEFTTPDDVDSLDENGNTALQIVCSGSMHENTLDFVKLLLEKKANPLKHEEHNLSAWKLVRLKPEISRIMKDYLPSDVVYESDRKFSSEDEFESADEA